MVEVLFNKELADITFEVDTLDEWKKVASSLGMTSQLELTKGDNSPIPYPYMNEVMTRVYKTLCPNSVDFREYKNTTVPLEVMQQIAFSVRENHFNEILIWADDKAPDPVVVGVTCKYYTKDKGNRLYFDTEEECKAYPDSNKMVYRTDEKFYIIARWGDELRDFATLKKMALERLINNIGTDLKRTRKKATEQLNCLKENCASYLNGDISLYDVRY